ncbi:MAG: hypothetical protein ACXACD_11750, partial [Candidatus Thorarchaeota archaeon]
MEFEDALGELVERYKSLGLDVVEVESDSFEMIERSSYFIFGPEGAEAPSTTETKYRMTREDIEEFAKWKAEQFKRGTVVGNCEVITQDWREQGVQPLTTDIWLSPSFLSIHASAANGMEVSLGPATQDYMKHFQFEKTFFDDYRSFLLDPYRVQTEGVHVSFRQESYPMTVKVSGSGLHSVEDFRKASDRVIESFFFSISVQDDICLGTATRLEQITPVGGKRGTDGEASELPTLKAHYNPEVLRFYWLGGSSEIPQHRFLAYYQVLE